MSQARVRHALRSAIEDVIYAGVLHLDASRFDAWLALTTPTFNYRIVAYSPELRKDMTWLEHDRAGLAGLFELIPKHHVDHAPWHRQAVLYTLEEDESDGLRAITSFSVYRTLLDAGDSHVDGGSSQLFVVGRYHDRWVLLDGLWRLAERTVRLETRQLGLGSHVIV
jgi:methanesulfonate monooxygenase small subunit